MKVHDARCEKILSESAARSDKILTWAAEERAQRDQAHLEERKALEARNRETSMRFENALTALVEGYTERDGNVA